MTLREIADVRQDPDAGPRRWFTGADLDLIVWEDEAGEVRRFQLAYDRGGDERLLQWIRGEGVSLHRVDAGETHPLQPKATPILLPDLDPPPPDLADRFAAAAEGVEPRVRDGVLDVLERMSDR